MAGVYRPAEVNATPIRIGATLAGGAGLGGLSRALRGELNDAGM